MLKLTMGTAQWGLNYGLTNVVGRLPDQDLEQLLDAALALGVTSVDTAASYGDAEERIAAFASAFSVQTKVSASIYPGTELDSTIRASLRRMGRRTVESVLIHDWSSADVASKVQAIKSLEGLKHRGEVQKAGASIYSIEDLYSIEELWPEVDVVQLPINVLDQTFDHEPVIRTLRCRGTVIQARSVFLQGVLLSQPSPEALGGSLALSRWFANFPGDAKIRLKAALAFIRSRSWVDEVIIGVTSARELEEISEACSLEVADHDWAQYASTDRAIIDPRLWRVTEIETK